MGYKSREEEKGKGEDKVGRKKEEKWREGSVDLGIKGKDLRRGPCGVNIVLISI